MTPLEFCADKSSGLGYIWPYVRLYVADQHRPALDVALAFKCELDELVERRLDPEIMRLRLHWWQNEITENDSKPSQHPLLQAIAEHDLGEIITPGRMLRMIDAAHIDHANETQRTLRAENSDGVSYEMLAAICGGDEEAIHATSRLGIAESLLRYYQDTNLAAVHVDEFYALQPATTYRMHPPVWVAAKLLRYHSRQAKFKPHAMPVRCNWLAWRAAHEAARLKLKNERN